MYFKFRKGNKKEKTKPKVYHLATLGEDIDLRCLLTAYSSSYLPQPNLCDRCKHPLRLLLTPSPL